MYAIATVGFNPAVAIMIRIEVGPGLKHIESTSHPFVKEMVKKERGKGSLANFLTLEGFKLLEEAVLTQQVFHSILCLESQLARVEGLLEAHQRQATDLILVSDKVMERISTTESPQGIVSYVKWPWPRWGELETGASFQRLLYLDRLQDPGNVGTLIRSAAAMGIDAVLIGEGSARANSTKVVRSTMGTLFKIPIFQDLNFEDLGLTNMTTILADLDGCDITTYRWPERWMLVLGNEGQGPSELWKAQADVKLTIPMNSKVESLNAAVAGSMMLFASQISEVERS